MNDDTNANDDDDDIRATSVVMLGDSIEDATPLLDVATSIEDAVYSQFPSSLYKQKIRFLVANLQRNELLRTKVRAGTIQAIDLIQMTDEEFMTDAMRVKIESIRSSSSYFALLSSWALYNSEAAQIFGDSRGPCSGHTV